MRRRIIALKPAATHWEYAVAFGDASTANLLEVGRFVRNPEQALAEQLSEACGHLQISDRLATILPARASLIRWLEFPFTDPRKIATATPPELTRQLPEATEERIVYHQSAANGKTLAVAVDKKTLEETLGQFDDNHEPLSYLGLAPFSYINGLEWPTDSLLLCIEQDEATICRVENAAATDLRITPGNPEENSTPIIQQATALAHQGATTLSRLKLMGVATDNPLVAALTEAGFEIDLIQFSSGKGPVEPELNSVASLALAAINTKPGQLNLRSGDYRLKNDWQALKRRFWLAGGLLFISLSLFVANGALQYHQRTTELTRLQQQMKTLFTKEFPGEKLVVQAPLQLQSKTKELQKKAQQFGTDSPSALKILNDVSNAISADLSLNVREYLHNEEGLRLTGNTVSFDAISRLLAALQNVPSFSEVRILDSKQALNGQRVDFQLQIKINSRGGR